MSIQAERLMVEVQADVRDALRKLDQVEARSVSMGARVQKVGRTMGLAFGGAALVGGIGKTIKLAMDFDQTMRQVGVQTGQSAKQMQSMSKLALQMGKDTIYSAQDAGNAMLELSKGGLTAAQIKGGALKQALTLAAAGGLELGDSANYIVKSMGAFGLKASQASQITTALAGGANASASSVQDMGLALSQAGAGARNAGMTIQETTAALAAFSNAGINGSDAGTSLKTMLQRLVPQTKRARDEMDKYGLSFVKRNGDFKSMAQVAQQLQSHLGGLSQAEKVHALQTIFGSDATRAATVLMTAGAKGIRRYEKATNDSTKAQKLAKTAMSGAKGAWENFKGSVETAAIVVGNKLLPSLTKGLNAGADFVSEALTWGPKIESSFGWVGGLATTLGRAFTPLAAIIGGLAKSFDALPGPIKSVATQAAFAALVFPRLATSARAAGTSVMTSFASTSAKVKQFSAEMTYAETRSQRLGQVMRGAAGVGGLAIMSATANSTSDSIRTLGNVAGGAMMGFAAGGPWGAAIGGGIGLLSSLGSSASDAGHGMDAAKAASDGFRNSLDQTNAAITENTRRQVLMSLQTRGLIDDGAKLGVSSRDLVGAVLGQKGAVERTTAAIILGRAAYDKATEGGKQATAQQAAMLNSSSALQLALYGVSGQMGEFGKQGEGLAGTFANQRNQLLQNINATKTWGQALHGIKAPDQLKIIGLQASQAAKGLSVTRESVVQLARSLKLTPKQTTVALKAYGFQPTTKDAKAAKAAIHVLDKATANPKAHLDDKQVKAALKTLGVSVDAFGKKKATAKVDANTGAAKTKLLNINALLNLVGRNVSSTVTTHYQSTGRPGQAGNHSGGGTVPKRGGGKYGDYYNAKLADGEEIITNRHGEADRFRADRAAGIIPAYAKGGTHGKGHKVVGAANVTGLAEAVVKGLAPMKQAMDKLRDTIRKNTSGKREASLLKSTQGYQKRMDTLLTRQAAIASRLATANATLEARQQQKADFVTNTQAGMASQATVLNAGNTADAIQTNLHTQVQKVAEFAGMLKTLKSMGYSNAVIDQVGQAGVEGGTQAAKALIAANKTQVSDINASMASITTTASTTAKTMGASMYDAGIASAAGLVKGLTSQQKQINSAIDQLAKQMEKAFRRALKIKSPSKKTGYYGKMAGEGLWRNMLAEERNVHRAATTLAKAAIPTMSAPTSPQSMSGGQGRGVSFTFITHNPKDEPTSVTQNKALNRVASLGLLS